MKTAHSAGQNSISWPASCWALAAWGQPQNYKKGGALPQPQGDGEGVTGSPISEGSAWTWRSWRPKFKNQDVITSLGPCTFTWKRMAISAFKTWTLKNKYVAASETRKAPCTWRSVSGGERNGPVPVCSGHSHPCFHYEHSWPMDPSVQWCPRLSQFSPDDSVSRIYNEDDNNQSFPPLKSCSQN